MFGSASSLSTSVVGTEAIASTSPESSAATRAGPLLIQRMVTLSHLGLPPQ